MCLVGENRHLTYSFTGTFYNMLSYSNYQTTKVAIYDEIIKSRFIDEVQTYDC